VPALGGHPPFCVEAMKRQEGVLNLEVQGLLQKWSRHVKRYQRRFFRCQRDCISYFHYKGHPPAKGAEAPWMLDLNDVVRLDKLPQTLSFEMYSAKDERLLMCKASTFGEYKLWTDVLESKINYLRERGEAAEEEMVTHFETNTFTMLALMSPEEVDELAQTTLDELLLPVPRQSSSSSSSVGEVHLKASAASSLGVSQRAATTAEAAAWEVAGEDEEEVEGKQHQHLDHEQIESMAHRLGDGLAVMEELCLDLLSEVKNAEVSSKRRLSGRLFERYYASLEAHLLLRVGPVLGEEVLGVDLLMKQSLGTIMGLFACRKRVQQFDVTLKIAAEALSGAANGREGNMGTTVSALSEGSSALDSLLVTQATLVASLVSLTLREVKQRWSEETQALTEWFAPSSSSSASTAFSSSSSVSLDSKWGRSLTAVMPTIITNATTTTTPRKQDREPPLTLHVSAVFDTIGTILTGLHFDKEVQEDDELQAEAHYLRSKVFSSVMLYLTGELQTLPVQHVMDQADEAVVFALLQDLAECRKRLQALQAKYLGGADEGTTGKGGDDDHDGGVCEVFVTALERFMVDKAAAAILDFFLRTDEAVARLVGLLFVHPTWVQGDVTPLLVKLFKQLLEERLAILPSVVHDRFEARVLRSFLVLYLRHFLRAYVGGKHLDAEETMQCMNDENTIREWVDFRGKWTCREARMKQLWVLKAVRVFLLMPLSDGLGVFSDIYVEGTGAHPGVILHLYDLLRYCLKLRTDVSPSDIATVLAVVGAFVAATSAAHVGSPPPMPSTVKLLLELFPRAGHAHVTGEPWSLGAAAAAGGKRGRGGNPVSEETMLGITALVMRNNEKMRAAARKAALYSSPEHKPVPRMPEIEALVGGRKGAEVLEWRAKGNGERGLEGAGGIVVGKEQDKREVNGKTAASTATELKTEAGALVGTTEAGALGEMAEKEVVKPPVRRRMGMPFSLPSSPPSPHVKLISPPQESPPSSPTYASAFQRQASPPPRPSTLLRPPSMPTAAGPNDTKNKNGTRAQAVARPLSSSSAPSAARPTSSGSSSVTNPFEDEEEDEGNESRKNKESPNRSASGGMFGRRRDPMPAQHPPPQSTVVAPPSLWPSGASASPGRRRFRTPFAVDAQVEAAAPSMHVRAEPRLQMEPAIPSQPSESGPRRFGGGWGGDEVGEGPPQALHSRAVPAKQQQQQQQQQRQQQEEGERGGRRSFGGGKW